MTDSHVAWKLDKNVPFMPSPPIVDDLIYMVSDNGIVSCVEAKTGKPVWRHRFGGKLRASPIAADGRIYFFSDEGARHRDRPRPEVQGAGRQRARRRGLMASPAVAGKAFFLRTKTHLYRIEQSGK